MTELDKRFTEIDEILSYIPDEELAQIPEELKQVIKENKDTTYEWKFNPEIPLKDQNLSRETISFLSYIYIKYIFTDEQKNFVKEILEYNGQIKQN